MSARRCKGGTALLILDMISEFRFPDAERVLRGRDVVELVKPQLEELAVQRLVLTGVTSHQCVLFTAMDARRSPESA